MRTPNYNFISICSIQIKFVECNTRFNEHYENCSTYNTNHVFSDDSTCGLIYRFSVCHRVRECSVTPNKEMRSCLLSISPNRYDAHRDQNHFSIFWFFFLHVFNCRILCSKRLSKHANFPYLQRAIIAILLINSNYYFVPHWTVAVLKCSTELTATENLAGEVKLFSYSDDGETATIFVWCTCEKGQQCMRSRLLLHENKGPVSACGLVRENQIIFTLGDCRTIVDIRWFFFLSNDDDDCCSASKYFVCFFNKCAMASRWVSTMLVTKMNR